MGVVGWEGPGKHGRETHTSKETQEEEKKNKREKQVNL